MKAWLTLAAAVLVAALLAASLLVTPKPVPADAPASAFSAGRALKDIAVIAKEPHAVGSAANARVRDYLLQRMTALGLSPEVRHADGAVVRGPPDRPFLYGDMAESLVGVLKGRDRSAPAVALMAHYDSAPGSPGAGDDATGVAVALETARAIAQQGPPARDVVLLLTDGEEHAGIGAETFFKSDPLAPHVDTVINLESRGSSGRTYMFETGARNGGLVRALAASGHAPLASSAAVFVYRIAPNGTDLTAAIKAGKSGLNFAFMGGQFDYHAPTATLATLEPGAVQAMGDEVLPIARRLAFAETLPARSPDLVFSQVFGPLVLAYPPLLGWVVLAVSGVLLFAAVRRRPVDRNSVLLGVACGLGVVALAAALLWLGRQATGVGFGYIGQRPLLPRAHLWEAAEALFALAPVVVLARFARGRPGAWLGLLLLGLLAGAVLQALAPLAAHLLAWPLLLAAVAAAATGLGEDRRPLPLALLAGLAAIGLGWTASSAHFLASGLDLAPALAIFAGIAALLAWPLLAALDRRSSAILGLGALALALLITGGLRFTSPWTPRHPRATAAYYIADLRTGGFYRASPRLLSGPWGQGFVKSGGPPVEEKNFAPLYPRMLVSPAPAVKAEALSVTVARAADGRVHLLIPWRPDLTELDVQVRAQQQVSDVRIGTEPARMAAPGRITTLYWRRSDKGIDLSFRPTGPGKLFVRYVAITDAWPADAAPPPPRGPADMPWEDADRLVIVDEADHAF